MKSSHLLLFGIAITFILTYQIYNQKELTIMDDQVPKSTKEFPTELNQFKPTFLDSALEYNAIYAKRAKTKPWESKFLGDPYLPLGMAYPRDRDGQPMQLLAQINFAEMPPLPDYPAEGIVQFFLSPGESPAHVWGLLSYQGNPFDPDDYFDAMLQQDFFRVIYHKVPIYDPVLLQLKMPRLPDGLLPIDTEARLTFKRRTGLVTNDDYRFAKIFGKSAYDFFKALGQDGLESGTPTFNMPISTPSHGSGVMRCLPKAIRERSGLMRIGFSCWKSKAQGRMRKLTSYGAMPAWARFSSSAKT